MRALAVLGGVMLVAAVVVAVALASTTTKKVHAQLQQTSATTFQLTLQNLSANNSFGSADVEIPDGFPIPTNLVQVVAGGTKQWKAPETKTGPRRIELRSTTPQSALAPGEKLTLTFTADPAPCSTQPFVFTTKVKQSNNFSGPPGNDFELVDADGNLTTQQPSVVTASGTPTLAVEEFDSPQEKNTLFAVTVTATDECGNPGTGSVDLELAQGSNSGQLTAASDTTKTLANGEATFNVAVDASGLDYVLTASWNGLTADSDEFDVVDKLCGPGACSASDGLGTSVSTIVPAGGTLAIRFSGAGGELSCGSGEIIGSRITLDPGGYSDPAEVVFVWANSLPPGVGVPHYTLCYEDDKGNPSIPLPKCSSSSPPTCELHRSRTGVADLRVRVMLAPVDPNFDLG